MKKSHFIVGVLLLFSLCISFYGCQNTLLTEQRFITQLSDIAKQDAVAAPELLAQTEEQKSYQINENATLDTVADPDTDALQSLILVLNTPTGSSYDREILAYYILNIPTILHPGITIADINELYAALLPSDLSDEFEQTITYHDVTYQMSISDSTVTLHVTLEA